MQSFQQEVEKIWAQRLKSVPYQTLSKVKDSLAGRKLILYGAGRLAKVFWDMCVELQIPVAEIWDKNVHGVFEPAGLPITHPPKQASEQYSNVMILICSHTFNDEICADLLEKGFRQEQVIPCLCRNPYFGITKEIIAGYEWAFNFFSDNLSKQLVLDKYALHMLDKYLIPNTQAECYYEDCFTFGDEEVFIDGGAYIGDSAERFAQRRNGKYKHIYAFEPDTQNFKKAQKILKFLPNITLIPSGLWRQSGQMQFAHHDISSSSSMIYLSKEYTSFTVPVTSLDELFSKKSIEDYPTFIKMDIEGSEKEALLGAQHIIRATKPKLAICAYHKLEDIYELPQTILNIRSDYRMILRQHVHGYVDTLLYAI